MNELEPIVTNFDAMVKWMKAKLDNGEIKKALISGLPIPWASEVCEVFSEFPDDLSDEDKDKYFLEISRAVSEILQSVQSGSDQAVKGVSDTNAILEKIYGIMLQADKKKKEDESITLEEEESAIERYKKDIVDTYQWFAQI